MSDSALQLNRERADEFVHFLVPSEAVQENEAQEWLGRLKETEKRVRPRIRDNVLFSPIATREGAGGRRCWEKWEDD